MKRIRFILLAAVMLAVITLPAFGANENPNIGSQPVVTGVLTEVESGIFTLTDYWGQVSTINVDQDTRCLLRPIDEDSVAVKIECSGDNLDGGNVSVQYIIVDNDLIATRITLNALLIDW